MKGNVGVTPQPELVTANAALSLAAGPGALETDEVNVAVPRFVGHEGGHVLRVTVPMQEVT